MIIDFHTHTFPDKLAERAIGTLAESAGITNCLDGTTEGLRRSMAESGIDYSVLLPVATRPDQQETINRIAIECNRHSKETGLISFGGIHPDNPDYRRILQHLAQNGVKGIKLHPVFQQTPVDDIRYLRIISCACEQGLIVLIHAGYDISHPQWEYSTVPRILSMLDIVKPQKLVLAHMGGWNQWETAEKYLAGRDVWLDTSFSLLPVRPVIPCRNISHRIPEAGSRPDYAKTPIEAGSSPKSIDTTCPDHPWYHLPRERFLSMVRKHGADRILFGSDSPWSGQAETILALKQAGLTDDELRAVLGDNAAGLLQ